MNKIPVSAASPLSCAPSISAADFSVSFARGRWNPDEWLLVRSPRWPERSYWIQQEDCIANYVPPDLRPEDMQMGRDRTGESYVSMLYKKPFHGNAVFHTHCAFDGRMAPLIVLSPDLSDVHKEHLEIVLYDCGVNLWHHYFEDGKPSWKFLGSIDLELKLGVRYDLSAQLIFNKKGSFIVMGCDGKTFSCRIDGEFPSVYYAGITGCEGKNRFFDFSVQENPKLTPAAAERFTD